MEDRWATSTERWLVGELPVILGGLQSLQSNVTTQPQPPPVVCADKQQAAKVPYGSSDPEYPIPTNQKSCFNELPTIN